ncbi:poly-gamma-glutamate hydrolase family protein [Streptomyces odonnellii]|uniref:poly-gamma-glutamate hydrolase family protein n=1 Tax=Streptomyces odonnellii TaxID=1417980 RepID=UPI00099DA75F|nr:poly-gamma-glutamate hydrolase family protein [Streptomyces odonnellii]
MADKYASYAALAAAEVEGVDYSRSAVTPAGATWASIAIHGGGIEAGSGEMAREVAGSRMAYFEFAGLKSANNVDLHLTSTVYDEPMGLGVVQASRRCLSFHGFTGTAGVEETALGGLDAVLVDRVAELLEARGFAVVTAPSEIAGTDPDNICNKTTSGTGVQLEMSRAQRQAFFPNGDLSRAMRESGQRTAAFYAYAQAVRDAYTGYGLVAQTSVNVSRYTLMSAPAADVDLTATVSTDALAAGGSHFLALVGRYADTSNSYLARLEFTTSQAVALTLRRRLAGTETSLGGGTITGLTHAAGRRFAIRLQITGTQLRAKAWLTSVVEPPAWTVSATDSSLTAAGQIGTRSILSTSNTNTLPVMGAWADFAVSGPQRFVVDRSVNGIVKSHPAGTDVRLAVPTIVAL